MNASHSMRKAEVIALVPAAQHSKKPTPKAWAKGNFRTTTADADATRPHTPSPEERITPDAGTGRAVPADACETAHLEPPWQTTQYCSRRGVVKFHPDLGQRVFKTDRQMDHLRRRVLGRPSQR